MDEWVGGCSVPMSPPGLHHHGPEPGWLHRQGGPEGHLCCLGWVTSSWGKVRAWGRTEPRPSGKSGCLGTGQGSSCNGCEGLGCHGGTGEGWLVPGRSGEVPGGSRRSGPGMQGGHQVHEWPMQRPGLGGWGGVRGQESRGRCSGRRLDMSTGLKTTGLRLPREAFALSKGPQRRLKA